MRKFKHIPTGIIYETKDNWIIAVPNVDSGATFPIPLCIVDNKNSKDWEEIKEENVIKVKIIKASKPTYWYNRAIGEEFEVVKKPYSQSDYLIVNGSFDTDHYITSEDCVILSQEKKPEWTVITVYNKNCSPDSENLFRIQDDKRYKWDEWTGKKTVSLKELLSGPNYIHSVRRESDGEVFTVGDKDGNDTIASFAHGSSFLHKMYYTVKEREGKYSIGCLPKIKVKPKEWEITAYRSVKNDIVNFHLKSGDEIYSVKRLSDGVEFKIGDKIRCRTMEEIEKIVEFKLFDTNEIKSISRSSSTNSSFFLSSISKVEKLFTTEDGVDIYEGDNYWLTSDSLNYQLKYWDCNIMKRYENNQSYLKDKTKFSTKEAAEEYILMNKPCLSLNDVASIFVSAKNNRPLIDLVKLKLK